MEWKGIETERGDKLHDIKQENTARAIVKELKPHAAENKPEREFREQQAMAIATKIDETSENKRGRGFAVHVRELMDSMREAGQKMADAVSEVRRKLGDAIGLPGRKEKDESNRPPPVSKEHAQERVGSWYPGRNDKTLRDEGKQSDTPKRRETPEEQITRLSKERTKNEPKIDMPNAPKL